MTEPSTEPVGPAVRDGSTHVASLLIGPAQDSASPFDLGDVLVLRQILPGEPAAPQNNQSASLVSSNSHKTKTP